MICSDFSFLFRRKKSLLRNPRNHSHARFVIGADLLIVISIAYKVFVFIILNEINFFRRRRDDVIVSKLLQNFRSFFSDWQLGAAAVQVVEFKENPAVVIGNPVRIRQVFPAVVATENRLRLQLMAEVLLGMEMFRWCLRLQPAAFQVNVS